MEFTAKIIGKAFSEGEGKNGIWKRCEFKFDNGKKLSTFEVKIAEAHSVGEIVTIKAEENAKGYMDLKSMSKKVPVAGMPTTTVADEIVEGIHTKVVSTAHTDLLREILAQLKELVALAGGEPQENGD